jgi:hypothetical protein
MNFSKENEILLYEEDDYLKEIVEHYIKLNLHAGGDFLVLEDNLRCILKVKKDPTEFYTFDNTHRIRVYIPPELHIEKVKTIYNFQEELAINGSEILLKNVKLDIKVIKGIYKYYGSLILIPEDYKIITNRPNPQNIPNQYVDSIDEFKEYLDDSDISSFAVGVQNDFLLFSKTELRYKTDIGITNNKVATYSIKKKQYVNNTYI